jgi:hypothetical protein
LTIYIIKKFVSKTNSNFAGCMSSKERGGFSFRKFHYLNLGFFHFKPQISRPGSGPGFHQIRVKRGEL